ncbi:hypothetical protein, partial [Rathayibacter tritici]|uniref:hypothetical protein n=1 Tax=Rathayibacter tritici TaxID=33888 RepID=UPI000D4C6E00
MTAGEPTAQDDPRRTSRRTALGNLRRASAYTPPRRLPSRVYRRRRAAALLALVVIVAGLAVLL